MKSFSKAALLERARAQASLRPEYLGWVLSRYTEVERKTYQQLADMLGGSLRDVQRLRLCLRPRPEFFASDIKQIAERLGLDVGRLGNLIRHVDALEGIQADAEGHEQRETGLLLAARARGKKSVSRTKKKR